MSILSCIERLQTAAEHAETHIECRRALLAHQGILGSVIADLRRLHAAADKGDQQAHEVKVETQKGEDS